MSKYTRPGQKIKLKSVEELLGVVNEESAMDIEIEKIRPFKGLGREYPCQWSPFSGADSAGWK